MKLTITREQLHQGLQHVLPAIAAKEPAPTGVLIEATKDGVRLYGTDLDVAVGTQIPASIDAVGAVVVPAKRLLAIVKELPTGSVRLSASGNNLTISCGRATLDLNGSPASEFPAFPVVAFAQPWTSTSGDLQKLVKHVAFAASTEESRPVMNGVLWELEADCMRMVATDGHRLARMTVPHAGGPERKAQLIVPPKALEQIKRLFEKDEVVQIASGENHLGFRTATTQLVTRLIEGPYPNYEKVIPKDNHLVAVINTVSFTAALRRMSTLAPSTGTVCLDFSKNGGKGMTVSVRTADLGKAHEKLSVTYDGDSLLIGFNVRYLLDMLRLMPTDEIRMSLKAPERAAVCEPVGWDDPSVYSSLCMPLKLVGEHGVVPAANEGQAEGDLAA